MRIAMMSMALCAWATSLVAQLGDRYVQGREVELRLDAPKTKTRGELLVVGPDTVWILAKAGDSVQAVPVQRIAGGWYRRHGFTRATALAWGAGLGVASGAALAAACSSVSGGSCGKVLITVAASSSVVGLLAGGSSGSGRVKFIGFPKEHLRPLARFPGGKPLGLAWADLRQQP